MTSSALALTGGTAATGGTTITAFGLSTTGWGLIAVGLFAAGAVLVWAFTEDEIEAWAKESEWGSDPKRRKNLPVQLRNLHVILCAFKADCYFLRQIKQSYLTAHGTFHDYFDTLTLRIRPGMLHQGKSRFIVTSLTILDDNGLIFGKQTVYSKNMLHLPDEKTQIIKGNEKEPGMLLRRFSDRELLFVPDFRRDKLIYSFSIQLDLQGDGSELYPAKPLEIKGYLRVSQHLKKLISLK